MDCAQEFLIRKQIEYMWKIFWKNGVDLFFFLEHVLKTYDQDEYIGIDQNVLKTYE